ncbi:hypothetical protein CBL_07756 [Carabus blaptoides fortunei]
MTLIHSLIIFVMQQQQQVYNVQNNMAATYEFDLHFVLVELGGYCDSVTQAHYDDKLEIDKLGSLNISIKPTKQINSTSRWKLLAKESTLLRGVKRGTSALPNPSYDLIYDQWALEPKYCINPHDISTLVVHQDNRKPVTAAETLVKMEVHKEAVMSPEDTHLFRASPRLSYCPPRSYSRSTAKRETLPANISPAILNQQEQLCLVKREKTSPSPSPTVTSCMQPSSERSTVPLIKSEPLQQQQQLNVPPQLVIKSEHTTLNRTIATSPNHLQVKNEDVLTDSTSPGLTTDLENFQDLSEWCRRRQPSQMDAMEALPETDELNTPLIEQGEEFLFTSPTILNGPTSNITQDDNDDCYGMLSSVQPSDFAIDFYACADIESAVTTTAAHENSVLFECPGAAQYFINDLGGGQIAKTDHHVLNYSASTIMDNSFNIFTNTVPATISDGSQCADVYFNNQHQQQTTTTTTTAAIIGHQCSSQTHDLAQDLEPPGKKNLRLDFSNIWMENKMATIDTPEVINTALAMENSEFNLVKFINDSMMSEEHAQPEEDPDEQSQSASNSNDPTYSTSEVSEDEDYEPPWTKRAKLSTRAAKKPAKTRTTSSKATATSSTTVDLSSLLKPDVYDSELSNVSTVDSIKVVRRGRPPKRTVSISSESTNADTEVSRYRELRDKNNEASRRSRLNRKMKEQHLEQEAADLETRNRKLKVRVTELDKLVNSMRNNLMQMLLKK